MNDYGVWVRGRGPKALASCLERIQHSGPPHMGDTGAPMLPAPVLHDGCFSFFPGFSGEAVSPIIGDRPIDDCTAVDAFPGIEGQKKVRESFQHHQSFAFRAFHNYVLPRYVNERARGISKLRSSMTA
jgi:hypothetical protein